MRPHQTRRDAVIAWHFVSDGRYLDYNAKHLLVAPGWVYHTTGKIEFCENGMHASTDIMHALSRSKGSYLCRVAVWGDVVKRGTEIVGRNREVLEAYDVSDELTLFAYWCCGSHGLWRYLQEEGDFERAENRLSETEADAQMYGGQDRLSSLLRWRNAAYTALYLAHPKAHIAAKTIAGHARHWVEVSVQRHQFFTLIGKKFKGLSV